MTIKNGKNFKKWESLNNMKISPIAPAVKMRNFSIAKKNISFQGDIFEKKVCSSSKAVNWLNTSKFIQLELKNTLSCSKNEIGRGLFHKVYSIPHCNDYVLRVPVDFNINEVNIENYSIEDVEDKNLKINIGQEVAKINFNTPDCCSSVSLLKKQKGDSIGVAPIEVYEQNFDDDLTLYSFYSSEEMKKKYENFLSMLASFPVSTYEKLIDDIKEAAKCGYFFDYINSNNIMVDKETKTLKLTDMVKFPSSINWGGLLFALTNIRYIPTYINSEYKISEEQKQSVIKDIDSISKKYIEALKNKGISEEGQQQCLLTFFSMYMSCFMPQNKL